ncbi:DNA-binding Lrp family transcriptional regulator [Streptomyces griseochromogenes]|uniref:AsnC family transcriptional regulator n=1 Tax=Streptomyces griseochromogenes TaxID=68214 RepID=A0A1B1AUM6_9ACTN|nr:Lrp/AsnC family transcriptional regulator [Streptomyces griseochromogenes]ANP50222.1 AsnC family transcriptional regulator [Streptomyces griseochromogenes]MBP2048127.1 DNA-binding Lrp family transcriptional regulator [Streptomyces griseochromogenes]
MLDDLDRALIHALHIDGRAPFSRIAAVLGVSAQTVARRYRGLRTEAGLRVVGLADPHRAGRTQWLVRLTATARSAQDIAQALVRRPDTSWVKLTSGGTEITAVIHAPGADASPNALLLRDIPRTGGITAVSAHCLLHTYLGGPANWRRSAQALDEEQRAALAYRAATEAVRRPEPGDAALLAALEKDGRLGQGELARATGWSPATVARRLAELRAAGALFFDVEVDAGLFGVRARALLWLSVRPADLEEVGLALADHDELAFVAATTGPTNLVAQALCRDPADLHRYLTRRLGALRAVRTLETSPVLRTLKAASPSLTDLARLHRGSD